VRISNEYLPYPIKIISVREETHDTKTFRVSFIDEDLKNSFNYKQGQFVQVSVLGVGEAPISISSSPGERGFFELTVRKSGHLTTALHRLKQDDVFYVRGPYGNSFPFEELFGRSLVFVSGGIGLAPIRGMIRLVLENRERFKDVKILYGAKTPDDICFKDELAEWEKRDDISVYVTVDRGDDKWKGRVGLVTSLYDDAVGVDGGGSVAIVCGPPVMMKFAAIGLVKRGFKKDDVILTLERYMKCGIGKCGHCNIGGLYVCVDGPVFSWGRIEKFPEIEHVF